MSHASLAIALAVGSLPVTLMLCASSVQPATSLLPPPAPQYGEATGGDCRPDIGPGGIIQVHPSPTSSTTYEATLLTTPLPSGEYVYVGNGASKVKLDSWERYKLQIDYTATPPKSRLLDRTGAEVIKDFSTIEIMSRLSSAADNPMTTFQFGSTDVFDHSFLLQVFHKKGTSAAADALGVYYVTTVSMIKAP